MSGGAGTLPNTDGVLEALESQGLDPGKVVSCFPSAGLPGSVRGVRGCNVYDRCPFNLTRYGGFKGKGPKNIGYYFKANDGTTHQKEDVLSCFKFVFLMLERLRSGHRDFEAGHQDNPGPEIINIVAWEPGTIPGQTQKQSETRTKVFVKVVEGSKDPNADFHGVVQKKDIPAYRHPSELYGDSYESEMERDTLERMRSDPAFQTGPPELPPVEDAERIGDDDAGGETWTLGNSMSMPTEPVVSEPVKRV